MDFSTLQMPVLHSYLSTHWARASPGLVCITESCAGPGRVSYTRPWAVPGRVWTTVACMCCSYTTETCAALRRVYTHCEKSLFVLASRQKIPVLRTENPAVDTRTMSAAHRVFLKLPMPEKLRPENPGQKQQIRPENPGLLVSGGRLFTFPCQKR